MNQRTKFAQAQNQADTAVALGKLIRKKRHEKGWTLKDVAWAVGVSEGTVSRWENGKIKNMLGSNISILSQVLNIPVSAFFDENIAADQLNQQTEVGKVSNKRTLMPKINCRHYEPVQENDLDEIKKANNVKGRKERKKRPAKEQKAKQRQGELKNMILLSTIQNSISKK